MPSLPPGPRKIPPYQVNPTYQQQPIAPVHLSAAVQLQPGASGAPPLAALKNPMGQDMEILEVKFEISTATGSGAALGGSVACELTLGGYKLTKGSVPVWLFGRAENLSAEFKTDAALGINYNAYTWRLPRPLFIPAGALISPKFNHLGYVNGDLTVRVGYSGRACFKQPRSISMPWVASYASKVFNPINVAGSDSSQELDLVNATEQVFRLQRFVGRTSFISQAGTFSEEFPQSFATRYLNLRMVDSYGRPIVRTYTPFRSVFGAPTRSWELEEVGAELDPSAYYRVFLKKSAMTMAASQNGGQAQAYVSMVGWREEKP